MIDTTEGAPGLAGLGLGALNFCGAGAKGTTSVDSDCDYSGCNITSSSQSLLRPLFIADKMSATQMQARAQRSGVATKARTGAFLAAPITQYDTRNQRWMRAYRG
jgi:hypothetical protein